MKTIDTYADPTSIRGSKLQRESITSQGYRTQAPGVKQKSKALTAAGFEGFDIYKPGAFKTTPKMEEAIGMSKIEIASMFKVMSDEEKLRLYGIRESQGDKEFAKQLLEQAKKDGILEGDAYAKAKAKALKKEKNDSAIQSRSSRRRSPHPIAAQDGRDDGIAFANAQNQAIAQTQSQNARRVRRRSIAEPNVAGGTTNTYFANGVPIGGVSTLGPNYLAEQQAIIDEKNSTLAGRLFNRRYPISEKELSGPDSWENVLG